MLIRKLFKYEASHQVHEAWSPRCKNSIHGHSFLVEFLFEGRSPDSAHMVMDFGFVKKYFHPFIDSFDHTHILWGNEKYEKVNSFIKDHNERWITLPFNSSAEMQAKLFFVFGWNCLLHLKNQKLISGDVGLSSVKVHETTTGYAEYRTQDAVNCLFPKVSMSEIIFSPAIIVEWSKEFVEMFKTFK
jgi:6-pyruvoyltetrahydropterin/6-carboxytetrahydropterin synthase